VIDLGIIILPKSITSVYNIPATLSLGIIILRNSITSVHNIPATLSLGIIILPKSITSELRKIIIPRLRVAGIL
jgi:hypothetical protein